VGDPVTVEKFAIGQSVRRIEDARLLRGLGRYSEDVDLPRQAYAVLVRSPHAHARIAGIDARAALSSPGVLAVLTGADLAADSVGNLPTDRTRKRRDGAPAFATPRPLLARERVRHVGDPVVLVVADTREHAVDAAERVAVEYTPLPAVAATADARKPGAPAVWDEAPDNVAFVWSAGPSDAVTRAFERAPHVTRLDFVVSRVAVAPMEPRAAVGEFDRRTERYTLHTGIQGPHGTRTLLAVTLNVGAYLTPRSAGPGTNNVGGVAGMYRTPAIHHETTGVYTNTTPTGPYRGAGRPEATYAIERVIDVAARELGLDPIELRRRNLIPPSAMPFGPGEWRLGSAHRRRLRRAARDGQSHRARPSHRRAAPRGGAGRRRAARRQVRRGRHRPRRDLRRGGARGVRAKAIAAGAGAGLQRDGGLHAALRHVPQRLSRLRGRDRPGDGSGAHRAPLRGRRRRPHREPDAREGSDPRRRGAGAGTGTLRDARLRRDRPAARRLVHGLRDAARGRRALVRGGLVRGADEGQPPRRQGRGRGGHGRRAAGPDERGQRRAGPAGRATPGHAGDAGARLAGDPGGSALGASRIVRYCVRHRRDPCTSVSSWRSGAGAPARPPRSRRRWSWRRRARRGASTASGSVRSTSIRGARCSPRRWRWPPTWPRAPRACGSAWPSSCCRSRIRSGSPKRSRPSTI